MDGHEIQGAPLRPVGEHAEEIAEMGPGLEAVELAAREQ